MYLIRAINLVFNYYMKKIAIFILTTILFSCNETKVPFQDKIEISYIMGLPEFEIHKTPKNFVPKVNEISDTSYISNEDYNRIKSYIYSESAKKHSDRIDVRMVLSFDTVRAYFGIYDYGYHASDSIKDIEYLVKCKSGYYNHIDSDEIKRNEFEEIIRNGIPKDYHYIEPDCSTNSKVSRTRSVVLLREEERK